MARYELKFKPSVTKDLRGLPAIDIRRILERIEALRDDPRPVGCTKLTAQDQYRVRQGPYRILYSIMDQELVIEVVKVGHRRDIYRDSR